MADRADRLRNPDELRAWALGAFHVAVLTVVAIVAVHGSGSLGDLLRGLDTATGVALYLVVWLIGWLATRAALVRAPPHGDRVLSVLAHGVVWGAAAGFGVVALVLLLVVLPNAVTGGASLSSVALVATIAVAAATVVGMTIGGLFALLDVALDRLADYLAPTPG